MLRVIGKSIFAILLGMSATGLSLDCTNASSNLIPITETSGFVSGFVRSSGFRGESRSTTKNAAGEPATPIEEANLLLSQPFKAENNRAISEALNAIVENVRLNPSEYSHAELGEIVRSYVQYRKSAPKEARDSFRETAYGSFKELRNEFTNRFLEHVKAEAKTAHEKGENRPVQSAEEVEHAVIALLGRGDRAGLRLLFQNASEANLMQMAKTVARAANYARSAGMRKTAYRVIKDLIGEGTAEVKEYVINSLRKDGHIDGLLHYLLHSPGSESQIVDVLVYASKGENSTNPIKSFIVEVTRLMDKANNNPQSPESQAFYRNVASVFETWVEQGQFSGSRDPMFVLLGENPIGAESLARLLARFHEFPNGPWEATFAEHFINSGHGAKTQLANALSEHLPVTGENATRNQNIRRNVNRVRDNTVAVRNQTVEPQTTTEPLNLERVANLANVAKPGSELARVHSLTTQLGERPNRQKTLELESRLKEVLENPSSSMEAKVLSLVALENSFAHSMWGRGVASRLFNPLYNIKHGTETHNGITFLDFIKAYALEYPELARVFTEAYGQSPFKSVESVLDLRDTYKKLFFPKAQEILVEQVRSALKRTANKMTRENYIHRGGVQNYFADRMNNIIPNTVQNGTFRFLANTATKTIKWGTSVGLLGLLGYTSYSAFVPTYPQPSENNYELSPNEGQRGEERSDNGPRLITQDDVRYSLNTDPRSYQTLADALPNNMSLITRPPNLRPGLNPYGGAATVGSTTNAGIEVPYRSDDYRVHPAPVTSGGR